MSPNYTYLPFTNFFFSLDNAYVRSMHLGTHPGNITEWLREDSKSPKSSKGEKAKKPTVTPLANYIHEMFENGNV